MEKKSHGSGKSCFLFNRNGWKKKKFFWDDFFLNFYRFIYLSYFLYGEKMDIIKEERKGEERKVIYIPSSWGFFTNGTHLAFGCLEEEKIILK